MDKLNILGVAQTAMALRAGFPAASPHAGWAAAAARKRNPAAADPSVDGGST